MKSQTKKSSRIGLALPLNFPYVFGLLGTQKIGTLPSICTILFLSSERTRVMAREGVLMGSMADFSVTRISVSLDCPTLDLSQVSGFAIHHVWGDI